MPKDTFTWWGTATCTLDLDGARLLTDPVLDAAGTEFSLRAPLTGQPLRYRNLLGSAATKERLGEVDLVLLSHDHHGDNFDAAGREVARRAKRVLTTRAGAERLAREGFTNVEGLAAWQSVEHSTRSGARLRITATPARHGPVGTNWVAGPVIGFVIERANGAGPVWVSGDTHFTRELEGLRARFGPLETAVLHLGAARFGPRWLRPWLRFSMSADEAVRATKALEVRRLVPVHFEGWSHFSQGAAEVKACFDAAGLGSRVFWPTRGQGAPL